MYAQKALLTNKNVILEKPFTNTYKEAKELFDIAKQRGLYIFEAITIMHNDILDGIASAIPSLGAIKLMLANYSQYSSQYDAYLKGNPSYVFQPDCYGGALRDINIYNIHYAVALFGKPMDSIYYPNKGYNGIDTSGTVILIYPNFQAICVGAKDSDSQCFISIQGENGSLRIHGKPNASNSFSTVLTSNTLEKIKDNSGASIREARENTFTYDMPYHRMTKEFLDFQSGREAASQIDIYLGGDGDISEVLAPVDKPNPWIGRVEGFGKLTRNNTVKDCAMDRMNNFNEFDHGTPEKEIKQECSRCLQCDLRLAISKPHLWADYTNQKEGDE